MKQTSDSIPFYSPFEGKFSSPEEYNIIML